MPAENGTRFYIGTTEITGSDLDNLFYSGTDVASEAYVGTTLVWSQASANAPTISTLTFDSITQNTFTINWTLGGGAPDSQTLEFRTGTSGAFSSAGTISATDRSFMVTGRTAGTTYQYRLTVSNTSGSNNRTESVTTTNASFPSVTTNNASSIGATSFRMSGTVSDDNGATVTSRYFFYASGSRNASYLRTSGTRVNATSGGNSEFTATVSGLSPSTTYSWIAVAENSAGTGYGGVMTTTTSQQVAAASWVSGAVVSGPSGGTAGTTTYGTFGAWYVVGNYTVTARDSSGRPTRANGPSDDTEYLDIRRDRSESTPYTGGTQTRRYTCTMTQSGTGTPTCAANTPVTGLPTGNVGNTSNITETGVSYTVSGTDSETRSGFCLNNNYVPAARTGTRTFAWSGTLTGGLSSGSSVTSYIVATGDATVNSATLVDAIPNTAGTHSVEVDVVNTLGSEYDNSGQATTRVSVNAVVQAATTLTIDSFSITDSEHTIYPDTARTYTGSVTYTGSGTVSWTISSSLGESVSGTGTSISEMISAEDFGYGPPTSGLKSHTVTLTVTAGGRSVSSSLTTSFRGLNR